ncbi:MAG: hypothetical protein H7068_07050 [Pedobacter sp.]|nr:hypothetical protein [Chitinophagaceae bacterium]
MKYILTAYFAVTILIILSQQTFAANNNARSPIINTLNKDKSFSNSKIIKQVGTIDFADVQAASNAYLPHNYVYTYYEAVSTRKKLEKMSLANPKSLGLRWALMRYYVSASNFVGGCDAKAVEQARTIFSTDNYIGCLAFEFVYNRLKKFDKAEQWYRRSIIIASQRDDFEWKEISYNKTAQTDVKVIGAFNNYDANHLYENNDATYSRRIATTAKNKGTGYKLIVDDRTTVDRP